MKWVCCPNHNIQHTPRRLQVNYPTATATATMNVRASIYQGRRCWNTLYIDAMSMECVVCPNHNIQHDPSEKTRESPTTATQNISGWGCIHMTATHSRNSKTLNKNII